MTHRLASTDSRLHVMELSDDERRLIQETIDAEDKLEMHQQSRPSDAYRPHDRGQRQFHQAAHIVRCLFPGNGFGKTTAAGIEANWWLTHTHPFVQTPKWPVIVIWCCETFKQFKILRGQLEAECFDKPYSFNKSDHTYTFPDGGKLFLVSGDSSWTHIQGINPDLVLFDEEPPEALWNEMKMRRRGRRKTRYVFAATATQGMTWMYHDLYLPWLKHHQEQGSDEGGAMQRQWHPRLWVWARGGIHDNPGADQGDRDWYSSQTFNSEAERSVRLGGGFADFSGTPVFDLQALEAMKAHLRAGEDGTFARVKAINPDDPRCINVTTDRITDGTERCRLVWVPGGITDRGRVTLYKQPVPGGKYVIGHDSAYGLEKGDFDGCVVFERNTGEQVAEANGHWGDARWAEILFALAWHYNGAFLCGERQVGLMVMRRLYDEMGYTYQYCHRDDEDLSRRPSDALGHHRMPGDLTVPRLRVAIGRRRPGGALDAPDIIIRSHELWRQLVKFQFRPKRKAVTINTARDVDLSVGAPTGDHDDLVFGCGYGVMGLNEVAKFEDLEMPFPEGSYGEVFKVRETLNPPTKRAVDPFEKE